MVLIPGCHLPVLSALGRLRQENQDLKASLSYKEGMKSSWAICDIVSKKKVNGAKEMTQ